jgi:hypothetical protein
MYIKSNFIEASRFEAKFQEFSHIPFGFFFDYKPSDYELSLNPVNIFAHDEPNEYFGHHDWVLANKDKFSLILTWSKRLLTKCDNSRLLLFGEGWVDDGKDTIHKSYDKNFEVSFIRGDKLKTSGQLVRHQIFNRQNELTPPLKFYANTNMSNFQECINGKVMLHKHSMFSLVIENTNHHNYFTEKITDCILLKSIPIYWGCSNINDFYNPEGILQFNSDDDAIDIINSLTPELYYEKLNAVEENWKKAFKYKNYLSNIKNILHETFEINNLL